MSILIKGVYLPQNEAYLDLVITADGNVCCYDHEGVSVAKAVELSDHGDLIEKKPIVDALAVAEKNVYAIQRGAEAEEDKIYCQGVMAGYANSILVIDNAPVIIPADRSEE